ncbi:glycosyltransferase [Ramlibacter albus]|uniref:Glycosyltransferase n=1 Tax=Ramlibacter albus TaxID=2079448 RepID=A0A923M8M5_9BURK|nr:glycosyltransferase [Ramlibacter albus]MBC5764759.1 glycosyltransferase [Ramlibacter albus]
MYDLEIGAQPYLDPWHLPLRDRLAALARGRKRRIAYFYEKADNSTFRYRVYNMAQVLNAGDDEVSAGYFFLDDLRRIDEILDLADMLVVCRTRYDHRVSHLIQRFQGRGKPVLFDTDDLVFDIEQAHLLMATLDVEFDIPSVWEYWFAYIGRLGATLKMCDGAVTTNDFLAQRIRDFADVPVNVVPNFMNREQLELSDRVFQAKQGRRPDANEVIHFGYFSGSPSHNHDFGLIAPALEAALEEDERLGVVVVGYIEAGPKLLKFGPKRVTRFPFVDYVNLQRLIGSVEFNVMPLQSNTFTHCKSELKYFEAAAVGTQSIASPTYTYGRAIRHGDNGWLAQAHQWLRVIREALAGIDGYAAMAERSRADALAKYAWYNQRETILRALSLP